MNATFTLDQVKEAFWGCFHEAGEFWFSYFGDKESNNGDTEAVWHQFLKELEKVSSPEQPRLEVEEV